MEREGAVAGHSNKRYALGRFADVVPQCGHATTFGNGSCKAPPIFVRSDSRSLIGTPCPRKLETQIVHSYT